MQIISQILFGMESVALLSAFTFFLRIFLKKNFVLSCFLDFVNDIQAWFSIQLILVWAHVHSHAPALPLHNGEYKRGCLLSWRDFLNNYNMKVTNKKSGGYNLIKGTGTKQTEISRLYMAQNRETGELWHAKVFHEETVQKFAMTKMMEFNETVLQDSKQKEHIICINEVFTKSGSTFIIQEAFDTTLEKLVEQEQPLPSPKIQWILQDVMRGVIELYGQKYFTRSIRPEHIVCVDDVWKLESFVLNTQMTPINSQICWNRRFASPEEKARNGAIGEEMEDEQIVWQMGMLALYMILGESFNYERVSSEDDIDWVKVKKCCSSALYKFMKASLVMNYDERLRLTDLFKLTLFEGIHDATADIFRHAGKYQLSPPTIKISGEVVKVSREDEKLLKSVKTDIERFRFFTEVNKYTQELPYRNNFDINFIIYLSYRVAYDNLRVIQDNILEWPKANPQIQRYFPYIQLVQTLSLDISEIEKYRVQYSKLIQGTAVAKSEVSEIAKEVDYQLTDNKFDSRTVQTFYMKMTGSIYTLLSQECNQTPDPAKERCICYYTFGTYLVNFYDKEDLQMAEAYQKNGSLSVSKFVEEAPIDTLIDVSQKIIKKYFAYVPATKSSV